MLFAHVWLSIYAKTEWLCPNQAAPPWTDADFVAEEWLASVHWRQDKRWDMVSVRLNDIAGPDPAIPKHA